MSNGKRPQTIDDFKSLFEDLKNDVAREESKISRKIRLPDSFLDYEESDIKKTSQKEPPIKKRGNSYDYNKMSEIEEEVEIIKKNKYEPREDLNKNISRLSRKKVVNLWKK